jgi:DNA-binding transcriptional regulator YiaG
METKKETFIYEGLGFPIELIDAPMKKVFGEWIIDIDMDELQLFVFKGLIHKPHPLTGRELRFMRKFLRISTTELGEDLGVSHAAIVKWEKEQSSIAPAQELYIRMFLLKCLNDKNFLTLFEEVTPRTLAKAKGEKQTPFLVDAKQIRMAS